MHLGIVLVPTKVNFVASFSCIVHRNAVVLFDGVHSPGSSFLCQYPRFFQGIMSNAADLRKAAHTLYSMDVYPSIQCGFVA